MGEMECEVGGRFGGHEDRNWSRGENTRVLLWCLLASYTSLISLLSFKFSGIVLKIKMNFSAAYYFVKFGLY